MVLGLFLVWGFFGTFTELCNHHHSAILGTFSASQKEPSGPFIVRPHPSRLSLSNLLSVRIALLFLHLPHWWDRTWVRPQLLSILGHASWTSLASPLGRGPRSCPSSALTHCVAFHRPIFPWALGQDWSLSCESAWCIRRDFHPWSCSLHSGRHGKVSHCFQISPWGAVPPQ